MTNKKNDLDWPGIAPQFGRRKEKKVTVTLTRASTKAANDADGANRKIKITVKRRKTTTTGAL